MIVLCFGIGGGIQSLLPFCGKSLVPQQRKKGFLTTTNTSHQPSSKDLGFSELDKSDNVFISSPNRCSIVAKTMLLF